MIARTIPSWFGVVLAGLGCVATLVDTGVLHGTLSLYTAILPPRLLHLPDRSLLTDAAHGPPFLTLLGVLVIYFLPALFLLLWTWRSWRQPPNRKQP